MSWNDSDDAGLLSHVPGVGVQLGGGDLAELDEKGVVAGGRELHRMVIT